ncbi:MAG: LytTR family DNA-binding domain-containing protein [Saprospiraceae bacterium]|nr:LytTR family DNA-binding domain-containing protein [Saprospiraceae bacterium]
MALKIGIVEDSQDNIDILEYMLDKSEHEVEIIGIAKTISEAKLLLSRPDIDLAFLDIQLKEGTIFEVLEELQEDSSIDFEIVFVTAHGSYENALKAIRFACLDFINKPVDQEELDQALDKVKQRVTDTEQGDQQVRQLLELIKSNSVVPSTIGIVLPKGVIEFVEVSDILFFEADQSICRVHMLDGKTLTSARHLGYYIELLNDNEDFEQSSKSHLVNLSHIKQYDHRERTIRFDNGEHLIASFRFSKAIRKRLMDRQKGGGFLKTGLDKFRDLLNN